MKSYLFKTFFLVALCISFSNHLFAETLRYPISETVEVTVAEGVECAAKVLGLPIKEKGFGKVSVDVTLLSDGEKGRLLM